MQGVRTPFLRLDNLVVGDYTFKLKVTDAAGQESTADVHVFVKPGLLLCHFTALCSAVLTNRLGTNEYLVLKK